MPRKDQVATFGYYDIEDIPDPVDNSDFNELRRLWKTKKIDRKLYEQSLKGFQSQGLSLAQAQLATSNKLVCPKWNPGKLEVFL